LDAVRAIINHPSCPLFCKNETLRFPRYPYLCKALQILGLWHFNVFLGPTDCWKTDAAAERKSLTTIFIADEISAGLLRALGDKKLKNYFL
jgi:hypothetical protein